jgi:hypothetical protein
MAPFGAASMHTPATSGELCSNSPCCVCAFGSWCHLHHWHDCCRYDFFFDEVPHTDRHGRTLDKEWYPITGP